MSRERLKKLGRPNEKDRKENIVADMMAHFWSSMASVLWELVVRVVVNGRSVVVGGAQIERFPRNDNDGHDAIHSIESHL